MAVTSIPTRGPFLPGYTWPCKTMSDGINSRQTGTIDADGEKVSFGYIVKKAGTLDSVVFETATIAAGTEIKVSFQDTTNSGTVYGVPDGTVDQYRVETTMVTGDMHETGLITSDGTDGGTKRTVAVGDRIAIVFELNNFEAGDSAQIGLYNETPGGKETWYHLYTGSSWALQVTKFGNIMLGYSDGEYVPINEFLNTGLEGNNDVFNVNTGTTPDEIGILFTAPYACKIHGMNFFGGFTNDVNLVLYNSAGTVLSTGSQVLNEQTSRGAVNVSYFFPLGSDITLTSGAQYRLTLIPQTATNFRPLYSLAYTADSWMAYQLWNRYIQSTERTNSGSWTDGDRFMFMQPVISSVEESSGGAGGGQHVVVAMKRDW